MIAAAYRALWPLGRLIVWLLVAAVVTALALSYVRQVHAARAAHVRACKAELRALKANPFVAKFFVPEDPCVAVGIVKAGR